MSLGIRYRVVLFPGEEETPEFRSLEAAQSFAHSHAKDGYEIRDDAGDCVEAGHRFINSAIDDAISKAIMSLARDYKAKRGKR